MAQAYATQKGAAGLELGDEGGHKEMIDAPMVKQVTSRSLYPFVHSNFPLFRRTRRSKWRALQAFLFHYCLEDGKESFE
jgi:hypothetical protein